MVGALRSSSRREGVAIRRALVRAAPPAVSVCDACSCVWYCSDQGSLQCTSTGGCGCYFTDDD